MACQGQPNEESSGGASLPNFSDQSQTVSGSQPGDQSGNGSGTSAANTSSEQAGTSGSNAENASEASGDTNTTVTTGANESGAMASELDSGNSSTDSSAAGDSMAEQADAEMQTGSEDVQEESPAPAELNQVLVFTKTDDYRHDSIGAGVAALESLGQGNGFSVQRTEQSGDFNDAALAQYDVVVFLSTTRDVLNGEQEASFERYIQAGGGWVGIHAAADTEYDWAWYGELLGGNAWFEDHPTGTPTATLRADAQNANHSSVAHLPEQFQMQDEWYNFKANPSASVTVLLRLDESTYDPNNGASGGMGADHPIAWYHEYDGGRAWYTGLGHRSELYQDTRFTQHLLGGLRWAAGVTP